MDGIEKTFLETRLRNLERRYARIVQHPDLVDISVELKTEINELKKRLQ